MVRVRVRVRLGVGVGVGVRVKSTRAVRGCYYLGCYLVVRLAARVTQGDGAWMVKGGGLGGFGGGWLAHLKQ